MQADEAADRLWKIRERLQQAGYGVHLTMDANHALSVLMALGSFIAAMEERGLGITEEQHVHDAILDALCQAAPELPLIYLPPHQQRDRN